MKFTEKVNDVVEIVQAKNKAHGYIKKDITCLSTDTGQYPVNRCYGMIILQALLNGKTITVQGERDYATLYEEENDLIPPECRGIKVMEGRHDRLDFFDDPFYEREAQYRVTVGDKKICNVEFVLNRDEFTLISRKGKQ